MANENTYELSPKMEVLVPENIQDVSVRTDYTKLSLDREQRLQIESLFSQLPAMSAVDALSDAYILKFPDGIHHDLLRLKRGGLMSVYSGPDGKIAGTASLHALSKEALTLQAFTAMSLVTGQYFLSEINKSLTMLQWSMDKILEFLYGEKKAELVAELNFVKYAHENFSSIMSHDEQRSGVIAGLIQSRKVAMKDIEFYMHDLDSTIKGKPSGTIEQSTEKACQIKDCLELSLQLYILSAILEVYYSENYDQKYINYMKQDISTYVAKCEKRILGGFSALGQAIELSAGKPFKKVHQLSKKEEVFKTIDDLSDGNDSHLLEFVKTSLNEPTSKKEYYIQKDGSVYLKTA